MVRGELWPGLALFLTLVTGYLGGLSPRRYPALPGLMCTHFCARVKRENKESFFRGGTTSGRAGCHLEEAPEVAGTLASSKTAIS